MRLLFFILAYALCFLFQFLFLKKEKQQHFVQSLYFKGLASLMFVVLAALSFLFKQVSLFTILIFIGLCSDALADVVFNLRFAFKKIEKLSFILGIFLFFTGHVFYLVALIPLVQPLWIYFTVGFAFTLISQIYVCITMKDVRAGYKIYGAVYIYSVSTMTAMGAGLYFSNLSKSAALLFAIGAVFFLISDLLLIFNTYNKKKIYPLRVISLVTYYTGQLLIASSLFTASFNHP